MDILDQEITPSVPITLGKKTYKLAFSMAAVLAFKQKTGRNMFSAEGWTGFNLRDDPDSICAFFWAALQTFHPEITYEQALRMANFSNMRLISDKCDEALKVFFPTPEPKEEQAEAAANPQ